MAPLETRQPKAEPDDRSFAVRKQRHRAEHRWKKDAGVISKFKPLLASQPNMLQIGFLSTVITVLVCYLTRLFLILHIKSVCTPLQSSSVLIEDVSTTRAGITDPSVPRTAAFTQFKPLMFSLLEAMVHHIKPQVRPVILSLTTV